MSLTVVIVLRVGLCFFGGCDCCFVDCGIGSLDMDGDIGSIDLGTWVGLFVGFGDWSLVVDDVALMIEMTWYMCDTWWYWC